MEPTASVNTEEKTIGNRTFYRSTYMGVSVVRTKDCYYNATKICQDCGIKDIYQITRYKWWKEYYDMVKQYGKYDHETNKITPDFDLLDEKPTANTRQVLNDQITDEILMFSMDRQEDKYNWISGTYVHEIFINMILVHVDKVYAFKVSYLINLMNEELHIRNITLEQKISEKEEELKKLQELHTNSEKGRSHELPGCIIVTPMNEENIYKIHSDEKQRVHKSNDIYINGIYNPRDTCTEFLVYAKGYQLEGIEWIKTNLIKTDNVENIKTAVIDIQNFNIKPPTSEQNIQYIKEHYRPTSVAFKGKMFEAFCSWKFDLPMYMSAPTETLSLTKADKGIDLLDVQRKRMAQCKHYTQTTVTDGSIPLFLDFCYSYPDYTHELYVLNETKISNDIIQNKDIKIIRVNSKDYNRWFEENTRDLTFDIETSEEYKQACKWLLKELETHDFLYVDETIQKINELFGFSIKGKTYFGALFHNVYAPLYKKKVLRHDKANGRAFISDPKKIRPIVSDGKILNDCISSKCIILLTPDEIEEERRFLIETIGYGQWTLEELTPLYKERFHRDVTNASLALQRDIFVTTKAGNRQRALLKRLLNKNDKSKTPLYELNNTILPDKYGKFKDFIISNDCKNIVQLFNDHFHRHDTAYAMRAFRFYNDNEIESEHSDS